MIDIHQHTPITDNLNLLTAWIESRMAYRDIPGVAIGIVHDQQLVWSQGYGYAKVEDEVAVSAETKFRIASHTKLFTATALLQLRDAGKLQLDDPVVKHLPWFNIQQPFADAPTITIRHLITHTSGLPREAASDYWISAEFPTIEEVKARLGQQQTAIPSETKWKYSNLALSLAGEIVAVCAGVSYVDYVKQHILNPLAMTNTHVDTPPADDPLLATGYTRRLPQSDPEVAPFTEARAITAAAGMTTSVNDMAKFVSLQFRDGSAGGEQILSGNTLREMQRIHWLAADWTHGWGLGFSVSRVKGKTYFGHGGALRGYRTTTLCNSADKIGVIVFINSDDGQPDAYAHKVFDWVAPALVAAAKPSVEIRPNPEWQQYIGKYRNSWSDTQVLVHDGKLLVVYPHIPDPLSIATVLEPIEAHTYKCIDEALGGGQHGEQLTFEFDAEGNVVGYKAGQIRSERIESW